MNVQFTENKLIALFIEIDNIKPTFTTKELRVIVPRNLREYPPATWNILAIKAPSMPLCISSRLWLLISI